MATVLIYAIGFFVFVAVTLLIPGLKTIITPVWAGLGRGILLGIGWAWGWVVFTIKGVYSAHKEILFNLLHDEDDVDLRKKMDKQSS